MCFNFTGKENKGLVDKAVNSGKIYSEMKHKTGKYLVVSKLEFAARADAGDRLRKVYNLLLRQHHKEQMLSPDNMNDNKTEQKGGTE